MALAGAAAAQDLPAAYGVTGVAADDVLNIRAEPSSDAAVVGSYAPDRHQVEVLGLSADGRWGKVGLPEGNGWVAMRYLAAEPLADGLLPHPFRCVGTEPFWGLSISDSGATFSTPEAEEPLTVAVESVAPQGMLATLAGAGGEVWTMTVARRECSDGMSDRIYGWETFLYRTGLMGNVLYSGCCTMDGG